MSENQCLREIPWETRNLAIRSFAVSDSFLNEPNRAALEQAIAHKTEKFGRIFIQARINKADLHVSQLLEKTGFYFVETALVPYTVFKKNEVLTRFLVDKKTFVPARYDMENLSISRMETDDRALCTTVEEIAGESFTDGRFHLDFNCTKEVADRRYSYWVKDMLGDPGVTFVILHLSGKPIAFMARRETDLLLAGFARQYVNSGLGDFFWLSVLELMTGEGLVQSHTMISANNTPVLNLYARIGFKFRDPSVTLHYWTDCCSLSK